MSKTKKCQNPLCGLPVPRKLYGKMVIMVMKGGVNQEIWEKENNVKPTDHRRYKEKYCVCSQCWGDYNRELEERYGEFHQPGVDEKLDFLDRIEQYYKDHPDKKRKRIFRH